VIGPLRGYPQLVSFIYLGELIFQFPAAQISFRNCSSICIRFVIDPDDVVLLEKARSKMQAMESDEEAPDNSQHE